MKTNISRRALAAGLALAPVAGLPALAGAVSVDDPIISALAELDQAKVRSAYFEELCGQASEAYGELRQQSHYAIVDGMKFCLHEDIDAHFDDPGIPIENVRNTIKLLLSYRKRPLTPEQQAEREAEREAARRRAHEELDAIQRQQAEARTASGYAEVDDAYNEAYREERDAERAIMIAEPTSQAGAIAALRFIADQLDDIGINDTNFEDVLTDAIRAAADFFEGRA
jgi:hypothetical protein